MRRFAFATLLLMASVASWVWAAKPASTQNIVTGNVGPTMPSVYVEANVSRLTDKIHWHTSFDEAKEQAQKEGKPIFWIHVLGDLDGTC
jgi:hypothetical protein